jgi:hypothetical protein
MVVLCRALSYDAGKGTEVPAPLVLKEGRHGMRWRRALAATALLVGPSVASADQVTIQDFVGEWRGAEVSVDAPEQALKLAPSDLDMTITEANGEFQIRALALGREPDGTLAARPLEASFAPTEVPGVFAFDPGTGSLLSSLFADPAVGNPLKGDTLLWARLQDDTLHVYSLAIDPAGGFALGHSTGRLTDDGMVAKYELRSQNDWVATVQGRLERAGD